MSRPLSAVYLLLQLGESKPILEESKEIQIVDEVNMRKAFWRAHGPWFLLSEGWCLIKMPLVCYGKYYILTLLLS